MKKTPKSQCHIWSSKCDSKIDCCVFSIKILTRERVCLENSNLSIFFPPILVEWNWFYIPKHVFPNPFLGTVGNTQSGGSQLVFFLGWLQLCLKWILFSVSFSLSSHNFVGKFQKCLQNLCDCRQGAFPKVFCYFSQSFCSSYFCYFC